MTDLKCEHRRVITEFLHLYRAHPTLWDLRSPEYNDRDSKRRAYIKLVKKLQEIEPGCSKQDVTRKINSLRSAFRKEYKKVRRFKVCGREYKSKLWYYDLISFTANVNKARSITDYKVKSDADKVDSDSGTSVDPLTNLSVPFLKQEDEEDTLIDDYVTSNSADDILLNNFKEPASSFKQVEDEFDAVGYNVATKLRSMNRNQRIIAERIISETLFQGQMDGLTVNTSCSDFTPVLQKESDVLPNSSLCP